MPTLTYGADLPSNIRFQDIFSGFESGPVFFTEEGTDYVQFVSKAVNGLQFEVTYAGRKGSELKFHVDSLVAREYVSDHVAFILTGAFEYTRNIEILQSGGGVMQQIAYWRLTA